MLQAFAEKIDLHAYWPPSPFPGLRPFQSTDKPDESLIFYGRNREKDEILARLNSSHLVFVVGPSGCGKSSLVKVGVLPALEAGLLTRAGSNWRIAEMRPGDRPLRNLSTALAAFAPDDATRGQFVDDVFQVLSKERNGLWLVAENVAPREKSQPLLLVIDQFEEIFGSQVTSQEECKLLLDAIISFTEKPHPNMYLIATMRTDFLGRCANFPKLADVINATLFVTPVLRDEDLKSVIAMPTEDYHGAIEPQLVKTIVGDASSELGYNPDHLPLLQHALLWLWNEGLAAAGLTGSPPAPNTEPPDPPVLISRRLYTDHGGLKGILNHHADQIYRGLDKRQQRIAETMFRRISERDTESRYRRSPAAVETISKLAGCEPAELEAVIGRFSQPDVSFIECRPLADGCGEFVDLTHESLIRQWDRLRDWADEEAEKYRRFRDMSGWASEWNYHGRSDDFLKSGGEIDIHEKWWKQNAPTASWAVRYALAPGGMRNAAHLVALTEEYLAKSRKLHDRNAWRHWLAWVTPFAAVGILMIAVTGITAYVQRQDAIQQAKDALQQKKAADDLAQLRDQFLFARAEDYLDTQGPTLALLTALSGPADNRDFERLTYGVLQELHASVVLPAKNQFPTASFSPDGRVLLYSSANGFTFWDVAAHRAIDDDYSPKAVNAGLRSKWSDDGNWIVSGGPANQTVLWAPCSKPSLRTLFPQCAGLTEDVTQTVAFADRPSWPSIVSPNGKYLLSGGWGSPAMFWDLGTNPLAPTSLHLPLAGFALAFDKTSSFLAIGSQNGSVQVRPVEHPEAPAVATLNLSASQKPASPGKQADTPRDSHEPKEPQIVVPVSSVAFSPADPDRLVVGTNDGRATLWNWRRDEILAQFSTRSSGWINVAFDPAGRVIAVTSPDGKVYLWTPGGENKQELRGHRQSTWLVDFNKTSNLLVSASGESVRIWSLRPALAPSELKATPQLLGVATIDGSADMITLRAAERGKAIPLMFPAPNQRPQAAALAEDGQRFILADGTNLKLYAVGDALDKPLAMFKAPTGEWQKVGFLRDPDSLVGQTTDGRFYAWRYFKDVEVLRSFAVNALPVDDQGRQAALPPLAKCRLGILRQEVCSQAAAMPLDPLSAADVQW
jgi:WD40 repeat protein